jgi:hypothetical protein
MDKIEYCAVIKFFVKEGLVPNEIHLKFIKVYGDSSPLFSTIKKWAAEFKCGCTSLLTADQKCTCMKIFEQCLEHFNKIKTDFVLRFITMDETWIHHYTPESKKQSKQWTEDSSSVPKKTRSVPSAGKVKALLFWDAEGILFIDCLERGKTIIGKYYSNLLTRLYEKIRE